MALALVLELSHARELAELCVAAEYPAEHRVRRNMALNKEYGLFNVDPARHEQCVGVERILTELCRVLLYGDSVQINNAIDAVVLLLKRTPVFYSSEIIAERECAGRLDTAENKLLIIHMHTALLLKNAASFGIVLELTAVYLVHNAVVEHIECAELRLCFGDNTHRYLCCENALLREQKYVKSASLRQVKNLGLLALGEYDACIPYEVVRSLNEVGILL